ncbi:hypothetical protein PHYPSEUDO_011353 [Phytophthora pseudosyringae]|uniref:Uncharacterized protein n=1 Tax=Phytophthora pseudosyringae TaxID=221518 RepID=A0A8T1WA20_9STRA|nr:hypothetical protein PHYPSEUDO_011353 [Phytophthora pseudosyringae]
MEPPDATAEWAQGSPTLTPTTKLESVPSRHDKASAGKHPGCTWPPEKAAGHQHPPMVAAWQGTGDLARIRQMHEPQVGGVPRSVLQRLLATPSDSAAGAPMRSPRRRCSAASAAVVAMVHSPRAFANSDRSPLEKRDPTAQTMPYHCFSPMFPTPEFGSYESSSNCSSGCNSPVPIGRFSDRPVPSDDEDDDSEDEVTMLRQQVALLVKSLEDEKKRRASEQHLMQTKIIELQGLIRGNGHEDDEMESDDVGAVGKTSSSMLQGFASARENERLENNQVRRWSAPLVEDEGVESSSCGCSQKQKDTSGEAAAKLQLTRLRARMHAIVIDGQRETQSLRSQLEGTKRTHSKQEKELTLETTIKVAALEQKHAVATTRLAQQVATNAAQVEKLQAEKQELLACMQAQQERMKQLELALGGKQIVDASR